EIRPQHIWIQALKDSSAKRLTSGAWSLELVLPPGSPPSHLSWSPDGKQIAFARVPVVQTGRIDSVSVNVVDVATGVIRPLTGATPSHRSAVWWAAAKSTAYVHLRDGRADLGWENEIYVSPAVGGEGKSVTRALDRDVFGAEWMGDGRSLLVAANDRTSVGLW